MNVWNHTNGCDCATKMTAVTTTEAVFPGANPGGVPGVEEQWEQAWSGDAIADDYRLVDKTNLRALKHGEACQIVCSRGNDTMAITYAFHQTPPNADGYVVGQFTCYDREGVFLREATEPYRPGYHQDETAIRGLAEQTVLRLAAQRAGRIFANDPAAERWVREATDTVGGLGDGETHNLGAGEGSGLRGTVLVRCERERHVADQSGVTRGRYVVTVHPLDRDWFARSADAKLPVVEFAYDNLDGNEGTAVEGAVAQARTWLLHHQRGADAAAPADQSW